MEHKDTQSISTQGNASDLKPKSILKQTNSLGICVGASTVSIVQLSAAIDPNTGKITNIVIEEYESHPHEGDPKHTLATVVERLYLSSFDDIALTGRKFTNFVNLTTISEPEATEKAYSFIKPEDKNCPAIVSAGGETFMVYALDKNGKISNVITGNKCASGTGEFFLQQLRRMDVSLDDAVQFASEAEPHHVSGRCSVFCKSDCTHATNAGIPKSQVTAGLCHMMANKVIELLNKIEMKDIMIVGGASKNRMMMDYLREDIPGLEVPKEAPYFEALGAALWALENETIPFPGHAEFLKDEVSSFATLPALSDFGDMVEFKELNRGKIDSGDKCILGLDVGSTTTKAILLRKEDSAMLASIYLRTNGDPVGAFRKCYQAILDQINEQLPAEQIIIVGLGVSGSGRQIAGLHAMTDGIINEIIAHATAAIHFDPDVDTLFEIGGQDAKYTFIRNSVPSDYAMNEACSAGTGSFLEESALETLGIEMEDIASVALSAKSAPNFNDQCAAFISSDIKTAIHEGIERKEIVAGLVYSVCINYANRVKGNRPVGKKVFMQGGVCYNKSVPLAMASLVGKPIIVPPEPGLMGAFGVALEVKKRIESGLMDEKVFNLPELIARDVTYGKTFICAGGKEKCDRKCEINMIELEKKKYPFGGACNLYYNMRKSISYDVASLELVKLRQDLVFNKYGSLFDQQSGKSDKPLVALNRSFLVNTYFPLYSKFFNELGYKVVMPDEPTQEGIEKRSAAFCYPVELAHGFFDSLLKAEQRPDYIFLPHFKSVPNLEGYKSSQVCPFVQGETFYLQSTFKEEIEQLTKKGTKLFAPLLDLTHGVKDSKSSLIEIGIEMGASKADAEKAFAVAYKAQSDCLNEMQKIGRNTLTELEKTPEKIAVTIFSRPYNGFVEEAHMGIPHKIASRGYMVIPFDFLPMHSETKAENMFWGMGQRILGAAKYVKSHPQLFGTFITNFSCGPDSFIISFFRDIMERKPSLTLELDSHTADAGLETRIEAFLDIVASYRQLLQNKNIEEQKQEFVPAKTILENNTLTIITSSGEHVPITDKRITVLIPSMGQLSSESLAEVMKSQGINAIVQPPPCEEILKVGRSNSTCKECLPLIITTGTMVYYIQSHRKNGEILVYFMPSAGGPCRFGQYHVFMKSLIKNNKFNDVAVLSLTSENSYAGLGNSFQLLTWAGAVITDVLEDIRSMLLANAVDTDSAIKIFMAEWEKIKVSIRNGKFKAIRKQLKRTAKNLKDIPTKHHYKDVPTVLLAGEIFVRREALSRQYITEKMAEKGFATVCSPIAEWIIYSDYLVEKGLTEEPLQGMDRFGFHIKKQVMRHIEKKIKSILSKSGLVHAVPLNIKPIIEKGSKYISPNLAGEAILTVGSAMDEIANHVSGVIAIGPFGCMPNRLAESILNEAMTKEDKISSEPSNEKIKAILGDIDSLPFLAIESDGSPFPQLINAKLETFLLRAKRLHEKM